MGNVADKEELHEAAKAGDAEKVEACIEKHAGQNGALDVLDERYGNTALMWAVRKGHITIVRGLIKGEASVDMQSECGKSKAGKTALMYAAKQGNLEATQELVRAGAALDLQNKQGFTALMLAADVAIAQEILTAGASLGALDTEGKTAFEHAEERNNADVAKFLRDSMVAKKEREDVPKLP